MPCRPAPSRVSCSCGRVSRSRGETSPLPAAVPARVVERRLFDRLSDVQTPQGILAVFPFPSVALPIRTTRRRWRWSLDRLRDPGNLGTLLRAAAGAGVNAVYLSPETVDPWNPKVVRAGMGAHFRVPLIPLDAGSPRRAAAAPAAPRRRQRRGHASLRRHRLDGSGGAGHRWRGGGGRSRAAGVGHRGGRHPAGPRRGVAQRGRGRERSSSSRRLGSAVWPASRGPSEALSAGRLAACRSPIYRVCSRVFVDLTDEWMVDSASGPLV